MARSSWASEYESQGREKEKSRKKARERAKGRRRSEISAARERGEAEGLDRNQIYAKTEDVRNKHKAQDWDKKQAHKHRMYEYHHGKGAQRRGIEQMKWHARKRQQNLDFIDRVNSGEAEYTGSNLVGDLKSGRHWSQGALEGYDHYNKNRHKIKGGNTDFHYSDYVPEGGRGQRKQPKRPTYEQYMGQHYDPNYSKPENGNPYRDGGR